MRQMKVLFRDKEVQNPWIRCILIPIFIVWAVVSAIIGIVIGIVGSLIAVVLDPAVKRAGRKGFVDKGPNHLKITLGLDGFRRR